MPLKQTSVSEASSKPKASGIRIVHRVDKVNAPSSIDRKELPVDCKPVVAKDPSETWAEVLSQAEGDISVACTTVATYLGQGNVEKSSALPAVVEYVGPRALTDFGLLDAMVSALDAPEEAPSRLAALSVIPNLLSMGGKQVEPFVMHLIPSLINAHADKAANISGAANVASKAVASALNPHATRCLVDILMENMSSSKRWQCRVAALRLLEARAKRCPEEMGHCVKNLMPLLSEAVVDTRLEVTEAATAALSACCYTAGNRDLEPHIPAIVSCIAHPAEVSEAVAKLSATTFVQAMEDSSLSILAPLMLRALRERSSKTQRRASIIIENMSKLVQDPIDAKPFLPLLIPALDRVAQEAADPELRAVAGRARDALLKVKEAAEAKEAVAGTAADMNLVFSAIKECIHGVRADIDLTPPHTELVLKYVAGLGASLITSRMRGPRSWENCTAAYISHVVEGDDEASKVGTAIRRWALSHMGEVVTEDDEAEDELCNCEFSLAYGGRILLTNASLRLRRGRRYGLCGHNGAGKSTLMRAISNGKLDGFPPKEELRTVYVEHDIDATEDDTTGVDWIFEDPIVQEAVSPSREDVVAALESVGFTTTLRSAPIRSLSGGWKMKLALARAMLIKADILLLDEPTNHLDTTNVEWLQNYLVSMPDISSVIVSHDSGFLDAVVTDIIHYENRKLVHYPGNLSAFVAVKPEAKSYYELKASAFKFKFPDPGFLDGIKGKSQSVMRMTGVSFSYPGAKHKQLENISLRCSLGSRVAVLGRNGAGKSTLIKLLTGEMEPDEGKVWKHPNLRIAYVAQHAFHHIEEHLDSTPSEYMWWRFGDGEDREAKEKVTRKITAEEQAARDVAIARGERVVDYLNSRRMGKNKEYEYEIAWVGQSSRENKWVSRTELVEKMGLGKMAEDLDAKLAMYRMYRPMTTPAVLSHLSDFGLEEEIAGHNRIRGLSGGQKVKLVLAAAMWCQPHVLVLDEPTNYLDRDSLGALAAGINDFNGGVIMISHNSEFTSAVCKEEWLVADGKATVKGGQALPAVGSMVSLPSVSSVASISTLGESSDGALENMVATEGMSEEAALEAMEEMLRVKAAKRAEKERIAAEKTAKKAEKAKLRFAKKF